MSELEAFYRRFTLPEERKNRAMTEWHGGYRWFASSNVLKLEDHRLSGEMADALARLRQRRRDDMLAAVTKMLRVCSAGRQEPSHDYSRRGDIA